MTENAVEIHNFVRLQEVEITAFCWKAYGGIVLGLQSAYQ
jgi:hypothetical protein